MRQTVFSNGTLLIRSVHKFADSGEYICTASNKKGELVQSKIQLNVMGEYVIRPL